MALPSKTEINRCGDLLRSYLVKDPDTDEGWDKLLHALDVLSEFRSSFSYPLTKVTVGLRYMVKAESGTIVAAQRLKRMDRILHKLHRIPKMEVARMEDIGGCRAVLSTPAEVAGVLKRIERRWDVVRPPHDYVAKPKSSGYRAVHLVVARDGKRIEIQLRTQGQQQWADAVEHLASLARLPLKDEQGPEEVLAYFRLAGEGIYCEEYGVAPEADFMSRFNAASAAVRHWMAARSGREG